MAIIGLVLFFIGIILIICYPINKKKNSRCSMQTQGMLREVHSRYDSDGPLKDLHVYSYVVNGYEYRLETVDHSLEVNNIGDPCTIWYNPAKPQDAQAFHGSDKYLKTLLIVGIVLTVVGLVVGFAGCAMQFG